MDKETIIDYVTKTPANTNKAVLSGMLDGIAQGGGAEPLIVTDVDGTLNKTWQEIYDAMTQGAIGVIRLPMTDTTGFYDEYIVVIQKNDETEYCSIEALYGGDLTQTINYDCNSANDYPVIVE